MLIFKYNIFKCYIFLSSFALLLCYFTRWPFRATVFQLTIKPLLNYWWLFNNWLITINPISALPTLVTKNCGRIYKLLSTETLHPIWLNLLYFVFNQEQSKGFRFLCINFLHFAIIHQKYSEINWSLSL